MVFEKLEGGGAHGVVVCVPLPVAMVAFSKLVVEFEGTRGNYAARGVPFYFVYGFRRGEPLTKVPRLTFGTLRSFMAGLEDLTTPLLFAGVRVLSKHILLLSGDHPRQNQIYKIIS